MKATDYPIVDFFNRYPDAEAVHEVSDQLFHDNAKDAAEARAKYYGLEIVTFKNPKKFSVDTIIADLVADGTLTRKTAPEAENTEGVQETDKPALAKSKKGKK